MIDPLMGSGYYKTYQVLAPRNTHFRVAGCEEVGCIQYHNGWVTRVDESTDLGQRQAHYIRHDSSRKATETRTATGLTEFTYQPGQTCFRQHQTRVERPELFVVRDGDARGNPRGTALRRHKNSEEWQEDFAEHQDRINDAHERG